MKRKYKFINVGGTGKKEHRLIVERAIGRPLPKGSVVHHVNGIPSDNRHENLVLCVNQSYHQLLHQRERALDACGNPNWKRCHYCKTYDDPEKMKSKRKQSFHRDCYNDYQRANRLDRIQRMSQTA